MNRSRAPRLSLDLLRGFLSAARYLSFTRAAQDLYVTRSRATTSPIWSAISSISRFGLYWPAMTTRQRTSISSPDLSGLFARACERPEQPAQDACGHGASRQARL